MPTIHILTGPTAVGKTEWALRWAEQNGAEIVSCDSLLFYRGMDIGTAKPSKQELARVPHHLIDICDIRERMDITGYVATARRVVDDVVRRGRGVLVTGGSGFYLKCFFAPVADDIDVSAGIRAGVAALSREEALKRLAELNPAGFGNLDVANPRRVTRALERCLASGRTLVELADEFAGQRSPFAEFPVQLTQLDRAPADLDRRIEERVQLMLRVGLIEEVKELRRHGLEENPSASKAIGYREVLAMLDGLLPEAALAGEICRNTRALVKKQRTWFRTQLPGHLVVNAGELQGADALFAR